MGMTVDELKKEKIWVCWKYVQKDGKSTKKPCGADGGITGVNHAFRASWVTFEEAQKAAEEKSLGGVGFIIPKGTLRRKSRMPKLRKSVRRQRKMPQRRSANPQRRPHN